MSKTKALIGFLTVWLLTASPVTHAELVVIANPHANLTLLTTGQLRRIFLGQSSTFPNGETAIPLDVADYRTAFYQNILGKTPEAVENYWASMIFTGKAQPPRQVQLSEAKQQVASSPRTISYIDRSQVDASVKVISIVSGQ